MFSQFAAVPGGYYEGRTEGDHSAGKPAVRLFDASGHESGAQREPVLPGHNLTAEAPHRTPHENKRGPAMHRRTRTTESPLFKQRGYTKQLTSKSVEQQMPKPKERGASAMHQMVMQAMTQAAAESEGSEPR